MFSQPKKELSPNELKLVKAAAGGDLKEVKQLIEAGTEVNFKPTTAHTTPLIEAAKNLRRDVVLFLLDEAKAAVDALNKAGETALMAVFGYLPFYIEDPNDPRANGVKQDKQQHLTVAEEALLYNCLHIAQILIDHGAQINFCESKKNSILLKAFNRYYYQPRNGFLTNDELHKISKSYHNYLFIKFLLEKGANVNFVDNTGYTPAMYLLMNMDEETLPILRLMIAHGMDVNAVNEYTQQSVLSIAAHGSGPNAGAVVKCLIDAGASRIDLYTGNKTDLMYAIQWDDEEAFTQQLQADVKALDAQDAMGQTALMIAIKANKHQFAARLIAAGAGLDLTDNRNQNALVLADEKGFDMLMDAGASLQNCGVVLLHKLIQDNAMNVARFKRVLSKLSKEQINSPLSQMTALYIAVSDTAFYGKTGVDRQGKFEYGCKIIALLLHAGADPTIEYKRIPTDIGIKPFDDSVIEGNKKLKEIYTKYQLRQQQPAAALCETRLLPEDLSFTSPRP